MYSTETASARQAPAPMQLHIPTISLEISSISSYCIDDMSFMCWPRSTNIITGESATVVPGPRTLSMYPAPCSMSSEIERRGVRPGNAVDTRNATDCWRPCHIQLCAMEAPRQAPYLLAAFMSYLRRLDCSICKNDSVT